MESREPGVTAEDGELVLRPVCLPWRAWLVHTLTALGAVLGLFALAAAVEGHARSAIVLLLISLVIDGVDGTVARSWNVAEALPQVDGNVLDVIVDFVNCVMVPMAFAWQFDMLPGVIAIPVIATTIITSGFWFSRTDLQGGDGWFNGFPAEWNLVIPTLYLLNAAPLVNVGIITTLSVLQLTSVKFVHPMRVVEFRPVTVTVTVAWLLAIVALLAVFPHHHLLATATILGAVAYHCLLSVRRSALGELPEATAPAA